MNDTLPPKRLAPTAGLLAILGVAACAPGTAEVLEEITVTAQKREQNIQDVGISITAFSGEQLERLGISASTDIAAMSPGVHVAYQNGGQARQFTIRGVGQNDFGDHAEPPNAVYVDEGYLPAQQTQVFATFDLDRVEVLKGPQGTLFGRNATGGLVHYITRKPSQSFDGYSDLLFGSFDQVRFEGAIGGPISESVSGRLAAMFNRHGSIAANTYPFGAPANPDPSGPAWAGSPAGQADGFSDFGDDNQWAVRGQTLWKPRDGVELLVSAFAALQKVNSAPYQARATTAILDANGNQIDAIAAADDPLGCEAISAVTGGCVALGAVDGELAGGFPGFAAPEDGLRPVQGGDLFGYRDPDPDDYGTATDFSVDDFNRYASRGATGKLTWDFPAATLAAITHFIRSERRFALDADSSPVAQIVTMADQRTSTFSQELRLDGDRDRLHWVGGLYFLRIDAQHHQGLANSPGGPFTTTLYPCLVVGNAFDPNVGCVPGLPPLEANTLADLKTHSYSLFGQVDLALTDRLSLVAGLRGIREEKDFEALFHVYVNEDDRRLETGHFIAQAGAPFRESISDDLWSGKLQLDFRPNDDWLLYAGVNRGVKSGSYNAPLVDGSPRLADADFGYEPEVLLAYEAGFKAMLFGGTTRLNASAYYYDYQDYQAFLFKGASGAIFNADAEYQGLELELVTRPVERLELMLSAAYIDATVEDVAVAPGVVRDVEPIYTPDWQLGALARYEWPNAAFGGTIAFQLDGSYVSESFDNIRNFQTHAIPSHAIGNVRLSWLSPNEALEAFASVSNFTDSRHRTSGYDLSTLCGCSEQAFSQPRWWSLRLRYNFGR